MLYNCFLFILLFLCIFYTGIVTLNLVWLNANPNEKGLKNIVNLFGWVAFFWTLFYFCK